MNWGGVSLKTLTICGSMRFEKEMQRIAWDLETKYGYNVLQCIYGFGEGMISEKEIDRLVAAHFRKIDLSDGIYVVDIDGYIGESVKREIAYAKDSGKNILYHSKFAMK